MFLGCFFCVGNPAVKVLLCFKVIKPESCVPCGKRIKFGKVSLKCRDCRVVSHPECRDRCPLPCIPTLVGTPVKIGEVCENFQSLILPSLSEQQKPYK